MAFQIDLATVPVLLTGILMLVLATLLLVFDFNNVLHRILALWLVFRGATLFIGMLRASLDASFHLFLTGLGPYIWLPGFLLTLLFISYYPFRRGIAKWRFGPLALISITVALLFTYMLDHSFYGTIGPTPAGFAHTAGEGQAYISYGPLFLIVGMRRMMPGVMAFVLARDYAKSPQGSAGYSRFLLYAAFALSGLYDGMGSVLVFSRMVQSPAMFPWFPLGWSQFIPPVIGFFFAIASLWFIYKASKGEKDSPALQEPRRFLMYVAPTAILSGFILYQPALAAQMDGTLIFILGIWQLATPLLITYALLRYQAFGADMAIKAGLAKAILVGMFTIAFFVILEAAEALLGDGLGWWFNIFLAALLALVASPVQQFAANAAQKIMPDTQAVVDKSPFERGEFYRSQHQLVNEDGRLSAKDREMLDRLAISLQLTSSQQKKLENGINQLPVKLATTESIQPKSPLQRYVAAGAIALMFGAVGQGLESLVPAGSFGFSLLGAAFITLAVGPVETIVGRAIEPADERKSRRRRIISYRKAAHAAVADGALTLKEKQYLDRLQKELGLTRLERARLDLVAAKRIT